MDKKTSEILKNPLYNFQRGDEEKIAKYLQYYITKYFDSSREWYQVDEDIITLEGIFFNSADNFDYKKLWQYLDKTTFCIDTKNIIESILFRIDYLTFKEEMNKLDDYTLVYNYYIVYGRVKNIPSSDIVELYLLYLKKKFENKKLKTETVFMNFFKLLTTSFNTYSYSGRSVRDSFDKITFDKENEYLELGNNERISKRVEASTPMLSVVDYLLNKINLNEKIEFDYEIVAIKDAVAGSLVNPLISRTYGGQLLIKDFLKLTSTVEFHTRCTYTNVLELNSLIDNIEEIKRLIRRKSFDLYMGNDYSDLKENGVMKGYPKDLLYGSVLSDKFAHQDLLDVLLSNKVKMIRLNLIYCAFVNKYLNKKEFAELLNHIEKEDILVYELESDGRAYRVNDIKEYIARRIATDGARKK